MISADRTRAMPRGERTLIKLPYLHAWRVNMMVTQDELSEKTGMTKTTLSRLENQRQAATLSSIGKIAEALGITRQQLAYEDPNANQGQQEK